MSDTTVKGTLKLTKSKYEIIEKAIEILEENGFVFDCVVTTGESSYHMGSYEFSERYNSVKDFCDNAAENYHKCCRENNMYTISWTFSFFRLKNEEKHIGATISLPTNIPKGELGTAVFFFLEDKSADESVKEFEMYLKEKLESLNC